MPELRGLRPRSRETFFATPTLARGGLPAVRGLRGSRELAQTDGAGAPSPSRMPDTIILQPSSEADHVRTDPAVRRQRQTLALELRAALIDAYGDARHVSYREIDLLVAVHDGHLPPPADEILQAKLRILSAILQARRAAEAPA